MTSILEIEGIGPKYARDLRDKAAIRTVEGFWEATQTRKGRRDVAARTGIPENLILEWFNHADLMRIRGVGSEYSDLLEEAGVDSVRELSHRVSDHLHAKLVAVNAREGLVRRIPTLSEVEQWVDQAKVLTREPDKAKKENWLVRIRRNWFETLILIGLFLAVLAVVAPRTDQPTEPPAVETVTFLLKTSEITNGIALVRADQYVDLVLFS